MESERINPQLTAWANVYVIVGSAGAALIGLQLVVLTLIAGRLVYWLLAFTTPKTP